jgi:hypothetical protein
MFIRYLREARDHHEIAKELDLERAALGREDDPLD